MALLHKSLIMNKWKLSLQFDLSCCSSIAIGNLCVSPLQLFTPNLQNTKKKKKIGHSKKTKQKKNLHATIYTSEF